MIRLDKYLACMGAGSRQEVRNYIRQGRAAVDGVVVKAPDSRVDETSQKVELDGQEICYVPYEYYMLYKPAGVVSATEDSRDRTVLDLLPARRRKDLFPVGRLDKDTEGLLLITNDGNLAHRLLSPKKHVDKCYYAETDGPVTEEMKRQLEQGVDIGVSGKTEITMPARVEIVEAESAFAVRLTIQEGKYHQVKRMFQAVGRNVLYLKREKMGTLSLDPALAAGECRRLTKEELERL